MALKADLLATLVIDAGHRCCKRVTGPHPLCLSHHLFAAKCKERPSRRSLFKPGFPELHTWLECPEMAELQQKQLTMQRFYKAW